MAGVRDVFRMLQGGVGRHYPHLLLVARPEWPPGSQPRNGAPVLSFR